MQILNSWKEIAAYLGRGVRTAQRWEHDFRLPVHRPKGRDRSAVLAFVGELDAWLCQTPVRSEDSPGESPQNSGNGKSRKYSDLGNGTVSPALSYSADRVRLSTGELRRSISEARQLRAIVAESVKNHEAVTSTLHASLQRVVSRLRSLETDG
jgi:hypothetical protein